MKERTRELEVVAAGKLDEDREIEQGVAIFSYKLFNTFLPFS